jgi:hypothetical protein
MASVAGSAVEDLERLENLCLIDAGLVMAATFSSIDLMALFFNPTDALHGDLGEVVSEDFCFIPSLVEKPLSCWTSYPISCDGVS